MNLDNALSLVSKSNEWNANNCITAVAYTPGNLDGEFHVFTLTWMNDDVDEEGNLSEWFQINLNAGSIHSSSCGVEDEYGGSTVVELKESLKEADILDLLNTLNFKVIEKNSVEFFMSTTDHCLKVFFGDEIGDNDFMCKEDEQRFRKQAIALIENLKISG